MFKVKAFGRDVDALLLVVLGLAVLVFGLAAPDWLWERSLDRIGVIIGAVGLPTLAVLARYVLRGIGSVQTGKTVAAAIGAEGGTDGLVDAVVVGGAVPIAMRRWTNPPVEQPPISEAIDPGAVTVGGEEVHDFSAGA